MRLRAMGRHLIVRMDTESIDKAAAQSMIQLPREVIEKEKGGCQVATVLSIGDAVFEDESPTERDLVTVGTKVLTTRYPGHVVGTNILATDAQVNEFRVIASSEIHAIVHEDGTDV